ncbi:hypothetical protein IWQ60_012340 [Tieghemiomyces parasiticus]|uniref:Peroxisomal membrane protein 4 n=1 Tax=Tieghemiomyces parasiticus TaxID=78921 RepID=A0A9W7ZQA5_9FUNG|nr:hypothetical protein IWQ60_012340 [Tieghemiomyces parasiticus]
MEALQRVALDPRYHDVLAILKGLRNGLVYGAKIRFPHALVMTFLFRSGSLRDKARVVFKATRAHAQNLGAFVTIYKSLMFALRKLSGNKEASHHSFLAGLVGGYVVFGENNNINNQCRSIVRSAAVTDAASTPRSLYPPPRTRQIVMYLFSRVAIGLAKLAVEKRVVDEPHRPFPVFAAVVWGLVMWLFRHERATLQPSLQASMQYLYVDSNHWSSLRSLFWHNK